MHKHPKESRQIPGVFYGSGNYKRVGAENSTRNKKTPDPDKGWIVDDKSGAEDVAAGPFKRSRRGVARRSYVVEEDVEEDSDGDFVADAPVVKKRKLSVSSAKKAVDPKPTRRIDMTTFEVVDPETSGVTAGVPKQFEKSEERYVTFKYCLTNSETFLGRRVVADCHDSSTAQKANNTAATPVVYATPGPSSGSRPSPNFNYVTPGNMAGSFGGRMQNSFNLPTPSTRSSAHGYMNYDQGYNMSSMGSDYSMNGRGPGYFGGVSIVSQIV